MKDVAGENAAILKEYGVAGAEQRTYELGTRSVQVTLFHFEDSTTAYGAYSFLRGISSPASQNVERSLLGNLILEVTGNGVEAQRAALKSLEQQLLVAADPTPYPLLAQYLPKQGLVPGSERFLLSAASLTRAMPIEQSDWVDFRSGAEAQLARYRLDGGETSLLLISYPTPQAAQIKQAELGRWFNVNNSETSPTGRPLVYTRRILSILVVTANASSPQAAESLLHQVEYRPNFSWNEPGHRATDTPILFSIYGIIVGTMVLLAFTFVVGVSFGGVRIAVKYFFPGKVFDRADTMQILQLGLTSKPIEAKDFY
jgi:hypothetical protein